MPIYNGCDVSNFQRAFTTPEAQCLAQSNKVIVVRLSTESPDKVQIARSQIQESQQAGMTVLGYPWAYFNEDYNELFQAVMENYHDLGLKAILIDCEDENNVLSPDYNVIWLHHTLEAYTQAGYPSGFYSGSWYWSHYMGNDQSFGNYVSWVANPNERAMLSDTEGLGGARLVGKQYSWDANQCGISPLDLDVFDARWIDALSGGLTVEEKQELDYLRSWYGLVKGDYMNTIQGHLDALAKGLYKEQKPDFAEIQNVVNTIKQG